MLLGLLAIFALTGAVTVYAHGPVHSEISALDEQLSQQPLNAALRLRRAELHRLDGGYDKALADLAAAEELACDLDGVWWVRARVLVSQGRPHLALADLDRWLEKHPRNAEALAVRARVRAKLGDHSAAIADFSRAIEFAGRPDPDLYLARAHLQRQLGADHAEAAIGGLDEGMARLGSLVTLQLEAISLEESLGRIDAALVRLDTLAAQASRKESWHVRRAELLDRSNRPERALEAWRSAWQACLKLPPGLRSTSAHKSLESRIRSHLSPEAIPQSGLEGSPLTRAQSSPAALLRTIPAHESTTP